MASSAGAVPMPTPFGLAHLNSLAADGAQYRLPGALRIPAQAVSHPSLLGLDAVPRAMPGGVAGTQPKRQAKAKVLATPVAVPDNAAPAVLSAAPAVASAEPLLSIRRSRSSVATAQIQQAQKLWQQGQLEQGRELLETALGQWPAAESWPVAKILLQHYLQHRAWQSAATIADKPWPQAQQAWARSMLLNAQGQSQAALALLTPLSPSIKQLEFYQLKAALLHKTQNYGAAAALYRRLLERQPNAGAYWLGLASCLEALHQPDAVAAYVKARQTNSGQAQVLSFIDKRLRVLGANRAQNAIEVSLHE
ncbi:MAG: hypothetical protein OIF38_01665 [Cellvibrionaceae bacterium]|nr:hypothetical protein [Cellvibrionaceae bacterium]